MSFVLSECQMKKRILSQSQMSLQSKNAERKRSEAVFLRFKFDIYDFILFKLLKTILSSIGSYEKFQFSIFLAIFSFEPFKLS